MAKILHHNDDDGRCAAYIVRQDIIGATETVLPTDFIEYNYLGNLEKKYPELRDGERVYIVDICMDDEILKFIKYCVEHNAHIVHIDHHASGIKMMGTTVDPDSIPRYTYFMKNGISGSMLTWIYANVFNDEDRLDPMEAKFDFDSDDLRERCCRIDDFGTPIDADDKKILSETMILHVPDVVRFIDDNDIWKQKIVETKSFSAGFRLCSNKHPLSHIWIDLFDETNSLQSDILKGIMNDGESILRYREVTDAINLRNGFFINVDGHDVVFLNTVEGNSMIFQEMYDNADAVCKYNFNGDCYIYTFYSKDDGADVSELVKYLEEAFKNTHDFISGGGHVHAAGCSFKKNFIPDMDIDKKGYIERRREIKIDMEVAAEQARLRAEEEKLRKEQDKLAALKAKIAARNAETEDYDF